MKVKLLSQKSLSRNSPLLIILQRQILASIHNNIIVLNHDLVQIGVVSFPFKNALVHYSYIGPDQKSVIMDIEYHDILIYFDVTTFKMVTIRDSRLKFVTLFADYVWSNNRCIIMAQDRNTREQLLLVIDTQTFTIKHFPASECKTVSQSLFNFLQEKQRYEMVVEASTSQKFLVLADYYGNQTLTFINTKTGKSRIVSIKSELNHSRIDKEGSYWASSLPHGMYYQNEWIVLIWESRALIISPTNDHKTINEIDSFMFTTGGFVETTSLTSKFIIRLVDKRNEKATVIQLYEFS